MSANYQHRSLDTHTSDGRRHFAAAADRSAIMNVYGLKEGGGRGGGGGVLINTVFLTHFTICRNKEVILDVLKSKLQAPERVPEGPVILLEIASGSGQHAAHMAPHFPWVQWQPTERSQDCFDSIRAWGEGIPNILEPIFLDASAQPSAWSMEKSSCVGILCVNMTHISPWEATCGLIAGSGHVLATGGRLFLYGPFMRDGKPTTESNAAFDTTLRTKNSAWGLRDVADIDSLASKVSLEREEIIEMPANNFTLVYVKR